MRAGMCTGMLTDIHTDTCTDICTDMCAGIYTGMGVDVRADMCIGMCAGTRKGTRTGMGVDMRTDMCRHAYRHVLDMLAQSQSCRQGPVLTRYGSRRAKEYVPGPYPCRNACRRRYRRYLNRIHA